MTKKPLGEIAVLLGPDRAELKRWQLFIDEHGAAVVAEALDRFLRKPVRPDGYRQKPSPWNLYPAVMELKAGQRRLEAERTRLAEEQKLRERLARDPEAADAARKKFLDTLKRLEAKARAREAQRTRHSHASRALRQTKV